MPRGSDGGIKIAGAAWCIGWINSHRRRKSTDTYFPDFSLVLEWLDMVVDEQEAINPFCLVVPLRINVASSIVANANTA